MRPVAAVKSRDEKRTKRGASFPGMRQRAAIGFRRNLKRRGLQVSAKFPYDGTKGRQVDLIEIGSGAAELLEQAQEMIRGAADRNGGETLIFRKFCLGQQLFRGEGQQQAEVLARGWQGFAPFGEERAKIRRRDELQAEGGASGFEKPAFQRLNLTASGNDDERRAFALPSLCGGLLEPALHLHPATPLRTRRRGAAHARAAVEVPVPVARVDSSRTRGQPLSYGLEKK